MKINTKITDIHKKINPIEDILKVRGITDIRSFIYPSDKNIEDYKLLSNIDKAVKALDDNLHNGSQILVVVDSDADGYTSAAMMVQFLEKLKEQMDIQFDIDYYIHEKKVHGLSKDCMNFLRSRNYNLVILPDAGTSDTDECRELQQNGTMVLVVDHHLPEKDKPKNEYAIIVNNQLSDVRDKEMTGVGVTYKFCQAITEFYNLPSETYEKYIDLVAVGMVADLCGLLDPQSRYLIFSGMNEITERTNYNQFIKYVADKSNITKCTIQDISFGIAPIINSVIRLGSIEEKTMLFDALICATIEDENGETIIEKAYKTASKIRRTQQKVTKESVVKLSEQVEECGLSESEIIVCNGTGHIEKSYTGLIANAMADKYKKPTLILNQDESKEWLLTGSARASNHHPLKELNKWCNGTGLFNKVAGHEGSFGIIIYKNKIPNLYEAISKIDVRNIEIDIDVDAVIKEEELSIQLVKNIGKYKYLFGGDIKEPKFYLTGLKVTKDSVRLLNGSKSDTLKITYKGMDLVKFKADENEYYNIVKNGDYISLNIVGSFDINTYRGNQKAQIIIESIEAEPTDKFITSKNVFG